MSWATGTEEVQSGSFVAEGIGEFEVTAVGEQSYASRIAGAPRQRLTELRILARRAAAGSLPPPAERERMGPAELVVFLQALPSPLPASVCAELDRAFQLRTTRNLEIRVNWILVQLRSGIPEGTAAAREVLLSTGRLRHIRAIYGALCAQPALRELALQIFAEARERYHPIARARIEDLLRPKGRS